MNCQLVVQFRGEARRLLGPLDAFEEEMTAALGPAESWNGLDAGPHGVNVFLFAGDPRATCARLRARWPAATAAAGFRAAYRAVAEEGFHGLWPEEDAAAEPFRLR